MKLEVELLQKDYENVLSGYAVMLTFRLHNLCVKANPVILLPVVVNVHGMEKTIEEVGKVGLRSDDQMEIYPIHEDLIVHIGQGVAEIHPELKQSVEAIPLNAPEQEGSREPEQGQNEFKYLRLTVPEVDKNRRDLLLKGVDAYHDEANTQMDAAKVKYTALLQKEMFGQSKDEMQEAQELFDNTYDQHTGMTDKAVADKQQEIEEAYQRYLEKKEEEQNKQGQTDGDTDVISRLKMTEE